MSEIVYKDCVVVGCGISGVAVAKWLKEYNVDFVVLEKSNDLGGLWRFKEHGDGVMSFTHINISKYNYVFSDFPFPKDSVEFMHHRHIYAYLKDYMAKFSLNEHVLYNHQVVLVEEIKQNDDLFKSRPKFASVDNYDRLWKVTVKDLNGKREIVYVCPYVSIATGHHGTPNLVSFKGQETFPGDIIHSMEYKNATFNKMVGKRVLVIGIGNSAIDAADNLVNEGNCPNVTISTRSGSWVYPNYLGGYTVDCYVNRFILNLPWQIATSMFESILEIFCGKPKQYNLNPKNRLLQQHPTISPTLFHHIQRRRIFIKPNIQSISGNEVTFENGEKETYDSIILCTGYKINLQFLHPDLRSQVFLDKEESYLNLFKFVFQPKIGSSLSFIGFMQPHSGGLLPISEIQARWLTYLIRNKTKLPNEEEMFKDIDLHMKKMQKRFYKSTRHTIQDDPITYNDEITSYFGAKPDFFKNIGLLWRLMFSTCGPAQWRLNGPDSMDNAADIVRAVPVPLISKALSFLTILLLLLVISMFLVNPLLLPLAIVPYLIYQNKKKVD